MAEKKNNYERIVDAFAESGLSDEEIAKAYPEIWAWWNSATDAESRAKRLDSRMGNAKFQKELRDWDEFADDDFSGYKEEPVPSNMEEAPMKDVDAWYKKAKRTLDPKGRLGDSELWDTAGDATFQQLEEKIGEDYSGDWFGNLIDAFGYPDTAEGYEQLMQDLQTVFSRKKIADKADKYGDLVDFVMGSSMGRMHEGFKPTAGDTASDVLSNFAWMVPSGVYLKCLQALRLAPKLKNMAKAGELMEQANLMEKISPTMSKAFVEEANALKEPLLKRLLAGIESNAVAPIINEGGKFALGSNGQNAEESAKAAVTETAVNMASPLLLASRLGGSILERFGSGVPGSVPGEIGAAISKGVEKLGEAHPMLQAYIDNRLGNDAFAERMKNMSLRGLKSYFGFGKEDKE